MVRNIAPYAITIFWGAFLLFLVQPLIGKFILPWFGGTPGVWTTCLLFFQLLLLGGYLHVCGGWFGHFREGRRLLVAIPFNSTAGDDKC